MNQELQEKEKRLRDFSKELERRNTEGHAAFIAGTKKSGHKRVNTDSCLPTRNLEEGAEDNLSDPRYGKDEDRSLLKLRRILTTASFNGADNEGEGNGDVEGYKSLEGKKLTVQTQQQKPRASSNERSYNPDRKHKKAESVTSIILPQESGKAFS